MNKNEAVGQPVWSLQTMLRIISQYDSQIPLVIPDGIYSSSTLISVAAFQQQHNLPITGVTDLDTWYAIVEEYKLALVEVGPAAPVNPIFQKKQVIHAGEINQHLYMIHGMMQAISDKYPSMPRVSCNNIHDEASVLATKWIQTRSVLPPTGDITRLTWKHISRLYRITVGDGTRIQDNPIPSFPAENEKSLF